MDEYIRLDTTIIGLDALINKAETVKEAADFYKAKDVIYSQQRYAFDIQPVKHGKWKDCKKSQVCSKCGGWGLDSFDYCPHCGVEMIKDGE